MTIIRTGVIVLILISTFAVHASSQTPPAPAPSPPGQPEPVAPPQEPGPPAPVPQTPAPQDPAPQEAAPQAVPVPPPTKIVPGASIAGVHLGGSARALRARLGLPSGVIQQGDFAAHLYGRLGLVVYLRQDAVAAVATTNSLFRIGGSLGVGLPAADARAEFGRASGQGTLGGVQTELYDDRGLGFGIDRGAIVSIIVFRPGDMRFVSTL